MRPLLGALLVALVVGCASAPAPRPEGDVTYVGSSTVGQFLREAEPVYGAIRFELDTAPESDGGEVAILAGRTDFAGIARVPRPETLRSGIATELIGRDAIAVLVNARNPVTNLSIADLERVFTGQIRNWSELGGPDIQLRPFVVGSDSATRGVFRTAVLGDADFEGCEEVRPDAAIVEAVAADPGGIGQLSFSFLEDESGVRAIAVDGQSPTVVNFDYPISRPLYLLWREGDPVLDAFAAWARSDAGQSVVMRRFVGRRVLGSVRDDERAQAAGTLVVNTETYPYYDGGIYYYPHRAYEIRTREGRLVRHVPNHRGANDERPTRVRLVPGTYLVRAETTSGETAEFLVTIEAGRHVELDLVDLLGRRP